MQTIFLDNNATTRVDDAVVNAMLPFFTKDYGNPSSMHNLGANANNAMKEAREKVKNLFGASDAKEIYFTGSGTESANMAIRGVLDVNRDKRHIITTKVEHPCVLTLYKLLEKQNYKVDYIDINSDGELDLAQLEDVICEDTALVSFMMANNETGVIFPLEKTVKVIKEGNPAAKIFVDAVQGAGKIPINVKDSGVDLMSISGHKIHAPKGIGALYVRSGVFISPLIVGGHQERGKRAGTENVPYIVGMGKASELALEFLDYETTKVEQMRNKLENEILKTVYSARLNTGRAHRVPNTTNIGFEYIEGELILLHLNDFGICASSGSACTSGSLEPSHVLRAMGVPFTALHGSIRFSLSRYTTDDEIDYVIKTLPPIIEKLNSISPYQKELRELKQLKGF